MFREIMATIGLSFSSIAFAQSGAAPINAGRFAVVDTLKNSTILIDTATGKTWQLVPTIDQQGKIGPAVWAPIEFADMKMAMANPATQKPALPHISN